MRGAPWSHASGLGPHARPWLLACSSTCVTLLKTTNTCYLHPLFVSFVLGLVKAAQTNPLLPNHVPPVYPTLPLPKTTVADPEKSSKRWECTLDQSISIYRSNEPRQASDASTTVRYCYYQPGPNGSGSGAVDWAGRAKKGPVSALRWGFPGICPTALLVSRPTAEASAQAAPIYVDIALKLAGQMITRS